MSGGKKKKAAQLLAEGKLSRKEVATEVGVHNSTLSRWLKDEAFLAQYYEEFNLSQCQEIQTIHRLVLGAYEEFLKRLSNEQIQDVSTLHLVQLMDRLHRRLKETMEQLARLAAAQKRPETNGGLLSEEEYRELAKEILSRISQSTERPQSSGEE